MELDKTEIVIRQRTGVELMDLSLVVYKRHLPAILTTSALIGIPLLLVDTLAVMWMMGEDAYLTAETMDAPESYQRWRHNFHLVVLYVVQFSLISLPTTVYLGHRIFFDAMSVRNLIGRLLPIAWRAC